MLFAILCFASVVIFILGYEFIKQQREETRYAIKGGLLILGVVVVGFAIASSNKNDNYKPAYSNTTTSTSTEPAVTPAPEVTPVNPVATTTDTQTIEPEETDPVLKSLTNSKATVTQRLIDAISDVDNYSAYKVRKLQDQLSSINREIDRYNNNDVAPSQSDYGNATITMDEQIQLQRERMNSSSTYYRDQVNTYIPSSTNNNDPINTYTPSTTYTTPSTLYSSTSTPSTYNTTSYPSTATYTSTYVNPNANSNTVQVGGYVKSNGTYVAPHTRTAPNHTKTDNYSYHP